MLADCPLRHKGGCADASVACASKRMEAMGQHAAFEKGVEIVPHKLQQVGAGCGLSQLEEGRGVLPHRAMLRGLFGPVTFVVDRGAVRRPDRRIGPPADGLRTRLPEW